MNYQWYPGHMTKAKRMMEENIKLIDLVIEIVDARIPISSRNPDIDSLAVNKARIILLNKSDLADDKITNQWINYFNENFKGCTLKEIYYAGDNENYFKEILQQYGADEAIVLTSTFDVDGSGGDGSLNPNSTYKDWIWLLVRNKQGEWKHVDHGY